MYTFSAVMQCNYASEVESLHYVLLVNCEIARP